MDEDLDEFVWGIFFEIEDDLWLEINRIYRAISVLMLRNPCSLIRYNSLYINFLNNRIFSLTVGSTVTTINGNDLRLHEVFNKCC